MTDYSPIIVQPIVQGVVTFPIVLGSPVPTWNGEGISNIERFGVFPAGAYLLTLDAGLPGNAGAVQPGATLFTANTNVSSMITPRGSGVPPSSNITTSAIVYLQSGAVGVGDANIVIVLQTFAGGVQVLADPPAGFELIIWVTANG
jgi:hypothetical protein